MGDLFHPHVPDVWIDRAFAVMALAPHHRFQILTKHPERMRDWFNDYGLLPNSRKAYIWSAMMEDGESREFDWPLPNVWLGVSVEDQRWANERIPVLLDTPASVRFISAEPLLGPVDLTRLPLGKLENPDDECGAEQCCGGQLYQNALDNWAAFCDGSSDPESICAESLDWVIVGGESGPNARPMHPDWARSLRDQCAAADVPFFFKQWGEWVRDGEGVSGHNAEEIYFHRNGRMMESWAGPGSHELVASSKMWRVGKERAGRLLDGMTHHALPETGA